MEGVSYDLTPAQKASAVGRYFASSLAGYPLLVNLEVTRRCNARCDFCRYWSTPAAEVELGDYLPVVRALRPSAVVFTGGEPLLRRDLETVVANIRAAFPAMYLSTVTNSAALTVDRGLALWTAGLNQITVSMDFPDARHDAARGIPGLARRIRRVVPGLIARGLNNVVIQTVIKSDNLDCAADVVHWALSVGARVSVSAYTSAKNGNDAHAVGAGQRQALQALVDDLVALRRSGAPLASSTYYLQHIPEFFERGTIDGCLAGRRFVTVTPGGTVLRCSESSDGCPYTEWRPGRFGATACGACWVPCRGETQAPLTWERLRQVGSLYKGSRPRVA